MLSLPRELTKEMSYIDRDIEVTSILNDDFLIRSQWD